MRISELATEWPELPRPEVERLVMAALDLPRHALPGLDLDDHAVATFTCLARRRLAGEPLQYIEGSVQFGPVDLMIDDRALIPRPETEQLWERAVAMVEEPAIVVDLCTGSGNLALACKARWPQARVLASDTSLQAVELANENAARTGLSIEVFHGDLFAPLPNTLRGQVDLVVANPPYLAEAELSTLPPEVRNHEPHGALTAGPDGVEVLAHIAAAAPRWLAPGGVIACEISEFRGPEVAEMFADVAGEIAEDLAGKPRFVFGRNDVAQDHAAALAALRLGDVIGVPTDTVYGVAADVFSQAGVDRIYDLKRRPRSKPLPVLAATVKQVEEVAILGERARQLARAEWPGDVTYIVTRRSGLPGWIGDAAADTVGVRIPAHDGLLRLMRRSGPLAVTSANFSGEPEVLDDGAARALFGDAVGVYVSGVAPGGKPSAVVDLTGPEPRRLR